MSGGRESKPRSRNTRPIGLSSENSPTKKNPIPTRYEDGWLIKEPVASRLYQKSAIGMPTASGIKINDEELMFCHWHRHIPLPDGWLDEKLANDANFVYQIVAYDTIRSSGEKLVQSEDCWNLWTRENHPSNSLPSSKVRWYHSKDEFNIQEIITWIDSIDEGVNAEIAIVDEEMDVTMYRISMVDPTGDLTPSTTENHPNLGINHLSRRFYRKDELDWMNNVQCEVSELFDELNNRGLIVRPGFKYGCRWRVYSTPIEEDHAPWLMQMLQDVSKNWEGVCLSVRLAEGVNKSWVIAFNDGKWRFIQFRRHLPGR